MVAVQGRSSVPAALGAQRHQALLPGQPGGARPAGADV